jgi:hypothetical protein
MLRVGHVTTINNRRHSGGNFEGCRVVGRTPNFQEGDSMAKKENNTEYPDTLYGVLDVEDDLQTYDTMEIAVDEHVTSGGALEIAVYKLDKVIKVEKKETYKIVK